MSIAGPGEPHDYRDHNLWVPGTTQNNNNNNTTTTAQKVKSLPYKRPRREHPGVHKAKESRAVDRNVDKAHACNVLQRDRSKWGGFKEPPKQQKEIKKDGSVKWTREDAR